MKKSCASHTLFAAVLSLLAVGGVSAQMPKPGENAGIAIEQVGVLVYPSSMLYNAVYSGEVRVVISVDEQGKLTDSLVTGYTHEEFATAAAAAVKRWKYQPALVRGEPRMARAQILFEFRDKGVIVQTLPGAINRHMLQSAEGERYVYAPCRVAELDGMPTPTGGVVMPAIKGDGRPHTVTVEFYIDEEGRTRMPAVDRASADDYYAAAAVVAVEQWRFKPCLRKGRPVLVLAQQPFTFNSKP